MPRSNKKKSSQKTPYENPPVRPPPKPPPQNSCSSSEIRILLENERSVMIPRAISSGQKHGINLRQGRPNPGTGDCAFEAVIYNNNDRPCFEKKFLMSIDWYRRIFVTDMANRTLNTPYNTLPPEEWLRGWSQMLEPGAYERGIFGDLMLPGIACGVRKVLLIFNTNPATPHDPIYVVNPRDFDVIPDTDIPVVLCYNMSHYESLEPCKESDIDKTLDLVKKYVNGEYQYSKKDIFDLIRTEEGTSNRQTLSFPKCSTPTQVPVQKATKKKENKSHQNPDEINLEEIDDFLEDLVSLKNEHFIDEIEKTTECSNDRTYVDNLSYRL